MVLWPYLTCIMRTKLLPAFSGSCENLRLLLGQTARVCAVGSTGQKENPGEKKHVFENMCPFIYLDPVFYI